MSTHRILRDNRRDRVRGPDLPDAILAAAVALLALFGFFGRRKGASKVKARLSETEDARYREWARGEAAG